MKLIIDAREAYTPKKAGKGQWSKGFIDEMHTRDLDLIQLTKSDQSIANTVSFSGGISWHTSVAKYVQESNPDAYISPTSLIVPWLLKQKVRVIPIIHDLIAFQREPHNRKAKLIERLLMRRSVENAAHICTVSQATTEDVIKRYNCDPSRISPIFAGPMKKKSSEHHPDGKTILCVGTLCPRKNQLRLIKAFASLPEPLRSKHRLVLVGSRGWNDSEIIRHSQSIKGIEWMDYVDDATYQELLSTCTVFAYPSLYEGFGMQVLDALQTGIPVLTSDRGSLKEVAGSAAVVVDPESERSIASGLIAILEHEDIRNKLAIEGPKQAQQFSWKKTVDLFLDALQNAL